MRSTIVSLVTSQLVIAGGCHGGDPARGRLTVAADGVALDPRTRLEWTTSDHEQSLPWEEADRYCSGLAVGERRDWRLPELGELEALYDPHLAEPCAEQTCHLDPALRVGGPYLWTATARGLGTRFYFDAAHGTSFSPNIRPALVRRVLCVRASGT